MPSKSKTMLNTLTNNIKHDPVFYAGRSLLTGFAIAVAGTFIYGIKYRIDMNSEHGPYNSFSLTHESDGVVTTLVSPNLVEEKRGDLKTYHDLANNKVFYSDAKVWDIDRGDVMTGEDIRTYKTGLVGVTDLTKEAKEYMTTKVCNEIVNKIPATKPVNSGEKYYYDTKAISDGFLIYC